MNKRFATALITYGLRMAGGTAMPKHTGSQPSTRCWRWPYKAPAVSQQHRACRKGARRKRPLRSRELDSERRTLAFFTRRSRRACDVSRARRCGANNGFCGAFATSQMFRMWNTLLNPQEPAAGSRSRHPAPGAGDDFISKQFSGKAADTPAAFSLISFSCIV